MRGSKVFQIGMLSAAVVLLLSLIERNATSPVLFYLLFPGNAIILLVAGGHGGTITQERIALAAGFVVNVLIYFGVILTALKVVQKLLPRRQVS